MEQLIFEALGTEEFKNHTLEILVHEPVQRAHIVSAKDLGESVRVPALKQLPFLLEHKVVQLMISGHYNRPANKTCFEYWSISEMNNDIRSRRPYMYMYAICIYVYTL